LAFIIVEDDSAVADSLDSLLRDAGQETRVYASAEDMIAAGPPGSADTVVVDLGLPGISGSTVLSWLSALAVRPRVFVISGKSSGMIARETAHLPEFRVLRKPPAANWLDIIVG
jgi:FixJ family two-component response regulator